MIKKLLLILFVLAGILRAHAQVPVANFSSNVTSGCAPLLVSFTDQSSGSPKFWNWDFGNGQLSNLQNPTISYALPGTYSVTLVVRNTDGTNGITKTDYITVYPSPSPNLSANLTVACMPATIQFTDATIPNAGTIVKWQWDFGDGGTSTDANPAHQYTTPGFYTITLSATSSTGCSNTTALGRYIRIVPGVIPEFDFTNPGTCRGPFNVPFSNLTSGPGTLSYQWDFGNSTSSAQTNPVASFATAGSYNVSLLATSEFGCSGSIQKTVNIAGTNTTFTNPDTVCLGSTVSFQNTSSPAPLSSVWSFGNGAQANTLNGSATYPLPGIYTVKLINTYNECKDSLSKPLVVMDKPVVDFTAPVTTACKGPLTVNFQDASPYATDWQWDFGDGNTGTGKTPSHTYSTVGDYNVTLTITTRQGCTNTLTKPAFVRIVAPVVSFTNAPAGGCAPYNFIPTANATAIDGVTNYFWEYGDAGFTANTTTPTGPSHIYGATGAYPIQVTITTTGGCTATSASSVVTGTPPVANFSMSVPASCASDSVDFIDLSTPSPGVNEWFWDFGDGTNSTQQNPRHGFRQTGNLTVSLVAYNNKCASAVPHTQVITINPPIADFDYTVTCPNTVNFTDKSITDPAFGAITYAWDFGDGATSSVQGDASHAYAGPGTYTVKLTVTNGTCSFTYTEEIKLIGLTAAFSITRTPACKNEVVAMVSQDNPADLKNIEWSIDGNPFFSSGGQTTITSFPNAGSYSVLLRVTDVNDCKITSAPATIVVTGPVANFKPDKKAGCKNTKVTFNDLSSAATGIKSWDFDFGDGHTQAYTSATTFEHIYADTGIFIVKLTITDNTPCPDTYVSLDTIVITSPVAGFKAGFTTICPKTDLPFTDTSSGRGLHYAWDFGDGATSTVASPIHQYNATSGTFTVKLEITDTAGCTSTVTKTDYITVQAPHPGFTARDTSTICTLLETKFTFQGTDYESFYWDFGDGTTSTLKNPNHFYNTYGDYEAKLYLVGYGGCVDSVSDSIHVYNPYVITSIGYNAPVTCSSLQVDFNITIPPSVRFNFIFGDGLQDNSQSLFLQHLYNSPGTFAPALGLQDSLGCQVTIGGPTNISIIGALPLFGMDRKTFCDSGIVYFTDYTIGNDPVTSRTWTFDDGGTSSAKDPSHSFYGAKTYVVTQSINTQSNCPNSFSDTVRVYGTPHPRIVGDTVVCINDVLALNGTLTVPDTLTAWKWDLGSNGQPTTQNVSVKYAQAGLYKVFLEATNKLGCKDTTSRSVLVPQTPAITVNGNPTIVVGTGANIPVIYSPEVATYVWTPPTSLSCADCPVPFANPKFTTKYNVKVTDIYGCSADQDITITVVCNGKNYFVPNTFSPNGDGVNDVFMARGTGISRVSRMQVFNRWGEIVYEKKDFMVNDASAGWNGTYKGKPANPDVYIYVVEFVCENAGIIPYRGNVTLIR